MCPYLDAFNALGNLVGSPPLVINETILTLEHVMERLDAIEKKMLTQNILKIWIEKCKVMLLKLGQKWEMFLSC